MTQKLSTSVTKGYGTKTYNKQGKAKLEFITPTGTVQFKANTNIEITKKNKKKRTTASQGVNEVEVGDYGKANGGKGNLVSLQYFPGCPKINVLRDVASDAELDAALQRMNPNFNTNFSNGPGFFLIAERQNYGVSGLMTDVGYRSEGKPQQIIARWSPRSKHGRRRSAGALYGFTPIQCRSPRRHSMVTISESVEQGDDEALVMGLPEPALTATEQMRHERYLPGEGALEHRSLARAISETSNN